MILEKFNDNEKKAIHEILNATLNGPFFPDWEFSTLMGFKKSQFADILRKWPNYGNDEEDFILAVKNSMANLLGYPHGMDDKLSKYITIDKDSLRKLFERFKAETKKKEDRC